MASSNGLTKVFTKQFSAPLTLLEEGNCVELSVLSSSGITTIRGSASFQGMPSEDIFLQEGQSMNLRSANQAAPLVGLTISPAGTAEVMIAQG